MIENILATSLLAISAQSNPIALDCTAINFNGQPQVVKAEFEPKDPSAVNLVYSVVGNDFIDPTFVTGSNFEQANPNVIEFFASDERGNLAIRFLKEGGKWAVELAPADWRPVIGPIVTGRCEASQPSGNTLRPLDPVDTIVVDRSRGGPVNRSDGWAWGEATFACKIVDDGLSVLETSFSISDDKSVSYASPSGELLSGKFDSGVILTLSGVTYLHRKMTLRGSKGSFVVSVNYRDGRLWLNGTRIVNGEPEPSWVLGVCNKIRI